MRRSTLLFSPRGLNGRSAQLRSQATLRGIQKHSSLCSGGPLGTVAGQRVISWRENAEDGSDASVQLWLVERSRPALSYQWGPFLVPGKVFSESVLSVPGRRKFIGRHALSETVSAPDASRNRPPGTDFHPPRATRHLRTSVTRDPSGAAL